MKRTMPTVIIPTVGTGSRMGSITKMLNKALLPYKEKPILSHIIDQFPVDTNFIIPVGYKADQIKDFCAVAYQNRNITFVEVDDWTSSKSGTAYTLNACKEYINDSFWYVPCDTYFDENVISELTEDCYFVKQVDSSVTFHYTTLNVENDRITKVIFKEDVDTAFAFTGLMYIHAWEEFFNAVSEVDSVEFIHVIKPGTKVAELNSWLDFGNAEMYESVLHASQKFDFTKPDEFTYICNNRVVKVWMDQSIAKKKYEKTLSNPEVYPAGCEYRNNWLAYDFFPGSTLYNNNDPDSVTKLLNWLDDRVWLKTSDDITRNAFEFYKTKSLSRIKLFKDKYPTLPQTAIVNGVSVNASIIDTIDWDYLADTALPGLIHGDLQFDNIIVDTDSNFKLIDWRQEFAGLVGPGDIYYDLAKLAGGFVINYAAIKDNQFGIVIDNDIVTLTVPNVTYINEYTASLKKYVLDHSLDYRKVQLLVPIIFLNMSPLHTSPFDLFLWYLGLKMMHEAFL